MSHPVGAASATEYREGAPAPSRAMELTLAAVALVVMVVLVVLAQGIELRRETGPGQIDARFWPTMLGATGVVVAGWRLLVVLRGAPDDRDDLERIQVGGTRRLALTLVLTVAYVAVWNLGSVVLAGYEIQVWPVLNAVVMVALTWLYGGRTWRSLVLFPLGITAMVYVLFHSLLGIPL